MAKQELHTEVLGHEVAVTIDPAGPCLKVGALRFDTVPELVAYLVGVQMGVTREKKAVSGEVGKYMNSHHNNHQAAEALEELGLWER